MTSTDSNYRGNYNGPQQYPRTSYGPPASERATSTQPTRPTTAGGVSRAPPRMDPSQMPAAGKPTTNYRQRSRQSWSRENENQSKPTVQQRYTPPRSMSVASNQVAPKTAGAYARAPLQNLRQGQTRVKTIYKHGRTTYTRRGEMLSASPSDVLTTITDGIAVVFDALLQEARLMKRA